MKTINSKKLNKQIDTICDFNSPFTNNIFAENPDTGTDPTNTTMTIVITTINTQTHAQKLTV